MSEARNEYAEYLRSTPERWAKVKMRDVGRIVSGGTPSRDAPSLWGGGIPWVTPGELTSLPTKEINNTNETISKSGLAGSGANLLPEESLLITSRATLGSRAVNTVPMATNQGFKSLVPFNRQITGYLYHLVEKIKPELVRRASGTTFLEISGSEFGEVDLPLPEVKEAEEIAEILDTLDDAIRGTGAVVAKLRAMKLGLLHDLLTRGIDANGDLRPPQPEAPHLYKQTPLGWLPKEWDVFELEAITSLITSGSRGWARFYSDDGQLFVRSQNVRMGELDLTDRQHVRVGAASEGARTGLEALDFLVTITGNGVGNACVVPEKWDKNAFVSQHVGLVRFCDKSLGGYAGRYFVAGGPGNYQILDAQYGQSKPGISLANLRELRMGIPPEPERVRLMEILAEADEKIAEESTLLKKLRLQKSGLMDDLLTGRVSVTPLL